MSQFPSRAVVRLSLVAVVLLEAPAVRAQEPDADEQPSSAPAPAPPASAPAVVRPRGMVAPPARYVACVPGCRSGFYCVAGVCRSECNPPCDARSECVNHDCRPRNPERPTVLLLGTKSAGAAFALEFFLGFGIGCYYAGSIGWGVAGTIGSLTGLATLAVLESGGAEGGAPLVIGLLVTTIVLRLGAVIAAPIVASNRNEELQRKAGLLALAVGSAAMPAAVAPPDRRAVPRGRNAAVATVPLLAW